MDESLARAVRNRARNVCEYCRMPQALYPTVPFPIDHVISRQHGGLTILSNLAFACLHDNSHKGPNIAGIDPEDEKAYQALQSTAAQVGTTLPLEWSLPGRTDGGGSHDDRCPGHECAGGHRGP